MNLVELRCPCCGAGGELTRIGDIWRCNYCASKFTDNTVEKACQRLESSISAQIKGIVDEAFKRKKEEDYYNLRSLLWEKTHAKYTDSDAIIRICHDVKKIDPHDFLACFFEVANSAPVSEVVDFINGIDVKENEIYVDLVIDFMIKSLSSDYIIPTNYLIERAYRQKDLEAFEKYITKLESEAQKIDSGVYETMLPRDVFVAYSSKDINKVLELVRTLEENGLTCFVAMRNLQHGRGAVANYEKALHEAIDNSKILVFVSSKNSRNLACDAFKKELSYIKQREVALAPPQYRNSYSTMPYKYKKPRVEYRLDNERSFVADAFMKEFFAGLDYCETIEKVLVRVGEIMMQDAFADEENEKLAKELAEKEAREKERAETARQLQAMREELERERNARYEADKKAQESKNNEESESRRLLDEMRRQMDEMKSEKTRMQEEQNAKKSHEESDAIAKLNQKMEQMQAQMTRERTSAPVYAAAPKPKMSEERIKELFDIKDGVLVKYKGTQKEVEIPDCVTEIGDSAFEKSGVNKVIFPNTVTKIGSCAFKNSSLLSLELSDSVKEIGENAFSQCYYLKNVDLGTSVEIIHPFAFSYCDKLSSIKLPKSLKKLEKFVFSGCKNLWVLVIEDGVEEIGWRAFTGTNVTSVELPDSLKLVGPEAFGTKIVKMKLENPDNWAFTNGTIIKADDVSDPLKCAQYMSKRSWAELTKKQIILDKQAEQKRINDEKYAKERAEAQAKAEAEAKAKTEAEQKKKSEEEYLISCLKIVNNSVVGFNDPERRVTKLKIPEGITGIENGVFKNCKSITSVEFPKTLKTIGDEAFMGSGLGNYVTIPDSVISIGRGAFASTNIVNVWLPRNLKMISDNLLANCQKYVGTKNDIPKSVIVIGKGAFENTKILSINIPASVQRIQSRAFARCPRLGSVRIESASVILENGIFDGSSAATLHCTFKKPMFKPSGWSAEIWNNKKAIVWDSQK